MKRDQVYRKHDTGTTVRITAVRPRLMAEILYCADERFIGRITAPFARYSQSKTIIAKFLEAYALIGNNFKPTRKGKRK